MSNFFVTPFRFVISGFDCTQLRCACAKLNLTSRFFCTQSIGIVR